jgi:hypothetical protein
MIAGVPVIIILASSWLWYYVASGRLDIVGVLGTANQGTLLDPPLSLAALELVDAGGAPFVPEAGRPRWRILLNGGESCEETCQHLLYYTRQIHTAMGKYTNRIERVMVTAGTVDGELVENYPKLKLLYTSASGLETLESASAGSPPPGYFVVDPAGWVILSYAADADGKDIMADLKFLLKNSN